VTNALSFVTAVHFKNFRVLRKATLPLDRFTLLIGPNGSGKTTAMLGLQGADYDRFYFNQYASVSARNSRTVEVSVQWSDVPWLMKLTLPRGGGHGVEPADPEGRPFGAVDEKEWSRHRNLLNGFRMFSLDGQAIAAPVRLEPRMEMGPQGQNLAGVLDRLRDEAPEVFRALNDEIRRCLPEFDQILFETPESGMRAFLLRTQQGGHRIPAENLSQGTLFLIAILTIAYSQEPPPIVCFEDPDRGIHPRLLTEIRDALYRLSHPEAVGERRQPVQVIVTTHSPYLLDVYRDHPEAIVIAQKTDDGARFERLADRDELADLLRDTHLGDAWYSGVLGGVPADS
jgi:predicted ATPase